MLMGNGEEVVHDRETRFARRSGAWVLIGNFRRRTHCYSRRSEEGGRRPLSEGGVVHGRKVHEKIHSHLRIFFQESGHIEQEFPAHNYGGVVSVAVGSGDRLRKMFSNGFDQGGGIHLLLAEPYRACIRSAHLSKISGRGSGAAR